MTLLRFLAIASASALIGGCHGSDSVAPPPTSAIKLESFVASGLSAPVFLTQPLNDGRIFVVEQSGRIRIVKNGALQTTPFLDITNRVLSGGERGLLSVAFHPHYATNHYLYVYFTTQPNGDITLARYTATSADAADPNSFKLILSVAHSQQGNHNGGLLTFGPDGKLYAGLGDGGGAGDPFLNGQNFNALLASLLRLDVDNGDPYAIPPDNPFVGQAGKRGEIWAKGLRNPWRYAFDSETGLLYIADVGQDAHEEIDVVPATSGGLNYGWNVMEGMSCYNAATCTQTSFTLPVLDYTHSSGCSITGGYVYRGNAMPDLRGQYFFSDYCGGFLKSIKYGGSLLSSPTDWGLKMTAVTSFGLDISGEMYVMSGDQVFKLVPGA